MPALRFVKTLGHGTDDRDALRPTLTSPTRAQTEPMSQSNESTQIAQIKELQRRRSERRNSNRHTKTEGAGDGCERGDALVVPRHKLSRDGIHYISPYPSPVATKQTFTLHDHEDAQETSEYDVSVECLSIASEAKDQHQQQHQVACCEHLKGHVTVPTTHEREKMQEREETSAQSGRLAVSSTVDGDETGGGEKVGENK